MIRNLLFSSSRRIVNVMSVKAQSQKPVRVATFNILAPCYYWISGWWGRSESSKPDLYLPRLRGVIELITSQKPSLDIVCLQEFWFHEDVIDLFDSQLHEKYRIVKLKRPGFKTDGLAILIDRSINILAIYPIYFNDMNRRVALLVHLLLPGDEEVILMTTHLTYRSNYIDQYLRMSQIKKVRHEIDSYQKKNNLEHVPVLLAGDFNGCPEDAVYHYVMESGFRSSFKTVHNREPGVTHRLYSGEEILVDYIFFRNSTTSSVVPRQSMVLPEEYSDEEWPKDFTLSDHRMVMTEFELQTQDSSGQTGKL